MAYSQANLAAALAKLWAQDEDALNQAMAPKAPAESGMLQPRDDGFVRSASMQHYMDTQAAIQNGTPPPPPLVAATSTPIAPATAPVASDAPTYDTPLDEFKAGVRDINARVQQATRDASAKGGGQYDRNSQARARSSYGSQRGAMDIAALQKSLGISDSQLTTSRKGAENDLFMDLGVGNTLHDNSNVNINTGTGTADIRQDDWAVDTSKIGDMSLAEKVDPHLERQAALLALSVAAAPLAGGLTTAGAGGAFGGALAGSSPMLTQAAIQGIGTGLIQQDAGAGLKAGALSLGTQALGKYTGDRLHAAAEQGFDPEFIGDPSGSILDDFLPKGVADSIGGVIDTNVSPIVDSIFGKGLDALGTGLELLPEGLLESAVGSKDALNAANSLQDILTGEGKVDYGQNPSGPTYNPNTGYSEGYNPTTGAISPLVDPTQDVASQGDVIYMDPETGEPKMLPPTFTGLPEVPPLEGGSGGGEGNSEGSLEAELERESEIDSILESIFDEQNANDLVNGTVPGDDALTETESEDPNYTGTGGSSEFEDPSPGTGSGEDPSPTLGQPTTEDESAGGGGGGGGVPPKFRKAAKDLEDEAFRLARIMQIMPMNELQKVSLQQRIKEIQGQRASLAYDATAILDPQSSEYIQKVKEGEEDASNIIDPIQQAIEATA